MKDFFDIFKSLTPGRKGAVIGFLLGLILAVFGFWKSLLILIITIAGFFIGKRFFSDKDFIKILLDKIFPPGKYR